ncbi:MAG: hypothetical protein AABX23_04805 [Nanoarchaeota archaeon]
MNKKEISDKFFSLIRNKKELTPMCFLCGEDSETVLRKLEAHHVFGKAISDEMVNLCLNCHTKITDKQNIVKTKNRVEFSSEDEKLGFQLICSGKMLELIGERWQDIGFKFIQNGQLIS